MNTSPQKIYCSLDIETSGFDPLKNEVLEVGMAFFCVENNKLVITKEWTRVFKPQFPVTANILALTGITQSELDAGELFENSKQEIQELLKTAVIVGHNVIFDIKFLEAQGIVFSGEVIDTLDLVQFLMPTHHSYNLENLMHTFELSHKDAHRALADAKASVLVLEKLLGIFYSFPEKLRDDIISYSKKAEFVFLDLLLSEINSYRIVKNLNNGTIVEVQENFQKDCLFVSPFGLDASEIALAMTKNDANKYFLVFPKSSQVMAFWSENHCDAIFSEQHEFSKKKFLAFATRKTHTPEEIKFILKIFVWMETNWQHEYILDLNLSFFGGQFRSFIVGGSKKTKKLHRVVCCDVQTFSEINTSEEYSDRTLVMVGLNTAEQSASFSLGSKASWGYMNYLLKSYYNPELLTGNELYKEIVEQSLAKSDLFFGLVNALLNPSGQFLYVTVTEESMAEENLQKVRAAAENFVEYFENVAKTLNSDELQQFVVTLKQFFEKNESLVQWIELSDARCVFYSSPIDIAPIFAAQITKFKDACIIDSVFDEKIINYFIARLGISSFVIKKVLLREKDEKQQDLFSQIVRSKDKKNVECVVKSTAFKDEEVVSYIQSNDLPAAVLFPSAVGVKEFHEKNYENLQEFSYLVTQNGSGGSNKMLHNFSIHENSLLLATGKFILKHVGTATGLDPVPHLDVKTLVMTGIPFDQYTHPYQQAVATRFLKPFEEYSLPKALYNLHCILEFFITDSLERVFISDSKLSKEYGKVFYDYVKAIENFHVV